MLFFFKQKTAYEMRISDWSSDVCSSDLTATERLDIKHQIMRRASEVLPADAIIGTNTSALSITEIAAVVTRPERVIGMHFFKPFHTMKVVELICGLATDVATLEVSRQLIDAIGKAMLTAHELAGFTTSSMKSEESGRGNK